MHTHMCTLFPSTSLQLGSSGFAGHDHGVLRGLSVGLGTVQSSERESLQVCFCGR